MSEAKTAEKIIRQVVKYSFFKLQPEWRRLSAKERSSHVSEYAEVVESARESVLLRSYSTVGMRGDVDFMLWMVHEDATRIMNVHARLNRTALAGYLTSPHSFLATTKRSMYVDKHEHPGSESSRTQIVPRDTPYLFVYPFVKTRPWYALSQDERQKMMSQHIEFGHRYPSVTINTSYSFGIDDQEFVVAFEGNNLQEFMDLVMDLRYTKASAYTLRDTPAFTCVNLPISEVLAALG
ncbi:MAG TPA: chlorite dismutase family protein [Armatimonadota bacterium]|nr:chlorite dismutase family protein [Armatimonadota bacterium]